MDIRVILSVIAQVLCLLLNIASRFKKDKGEIIMYTLLCSTFNVIQ